MNWGHPLVRETVFSFTGNLRLDSSLVNPWTDVREACLDVINSLWVNTFLRRGKGLGAFPGEDGWGKEAIYHCLIEPYH